MTPESLFTLANQLALPGWLLLITGLLAQSGRSPRARQVARGSLWLGGRAVPLLLSAGYAAAIVHWWGSAPGGFNSLDGVASLFSSRGLLLAGWVHYLAFDLWVGRWQVDTLATSPAFGWAVRISAIGCLLMTFLFGPIGLLLFHGLLQSRRILRGEH